MVDQGPVLIPVSAHQTVVFGFLTVIQFSCGVLLVVVVFF
jgi:hypothetical protein